MEIEVVRFSALSKDDFEAWSALQAAHAVYESPFFSPRYAQAVAAVRGDALVARFARNGTNAGFFPFHRIASRRAAPIGGPITDYQGWVVAEGERIDATALLERCGVAAFDFNHAPAALGQFRAASFLEAPSPVLDLSCGFDAYWEGRLREGVQELRSLERKRRKIEREIGAIRFVADDRSDAAWSQLIAWKEQSYARLRTASILKRPWVRSVLEALRATDARDFAGMLSTAYAGDKLAAAHFGLRSATCVHWWFPSYDVALEKYSPGLILLAELARWAPTAGVVKIDLGRGVVRYKSAFANASAMVCEGSFERRLSLNGAARIGRKLAQRGALAAGSPRLADYMRRRFDALLGVGNFPD